MDFLTMIIKILLLAVILLCSSTTQLNSSPLYGGDRPSVAKEFNPKQVKLAAGTAECVRTEWIGDVYHRTVICVEWRMVKEGK